jgi:uncharacterized Tic20 family protein
MSQTPRGSDGNLNFVPGSNPTNGANVGSGSSPNSEPLGKPESAPFAANDGRYGAFPNAAGVGGTSGSTYGGSGNGPTGTGQPGWGQTGSGQAGQPFTGTGFVPPVSTGDERLWGVLSHLSIFIFAVFGPLIVWMVRKDDSPFVSDHAKEALNFQLTVLIANMVLAFTCVLLPLVFVVCIAAWVYAILAAVEANNGRIYRYPYTFRMVQ